MGKAGNTWNRIRGTAELVRALTIVQLGLEGSASRKSARLLAAECFRSTEL